jgi:hypothetical protein
MITNEIKSKFFANYIGSEAIIDFGEPNAWSGRSFELLNMNLKH